MGRRGGSPFLWYICQLLHHIKLAEGGGGERLGEMERVRERRWRTLPSLPLPPLLFPSPSLPLPSPINQLWSPPLCVQCHGEEIGKYIINKTDGPSAFSLSLSSNSLSFLLALPLPMSLSPHGHKQGVGGGRFDSLIFPLPLPFPFPLPLLPPFRLPFYLWV